MPFRNGTNIVSVCWGDHLIFGEGDGRLADPGALKRRMQAWRKELGAGIIHWRATRDRIKGRFFHARGQRHFFQTSKAVVSYDDFVVVPDLARELGLKSMLYVALFDEGWPLAPKSERAVSYHNRMHCQHVSWQSEFSYKHPQFAVADRSGKGQQWGVLCLAYSQVRRHFIARFRRLLKKSGFDGLFICLRSQSKPAAYGDQFGFNEPVRKEYRKRYGGDITKEDFDLQKWRNLRGEYLTRFIEELRDALGRDRYFLGVGAARGDIIGPPVGNAHLDWRQWIKRDLVDQLVIDQNASRCPSMWHDLWPMHRGYGYLQNYVNGVNMPGLADHLRKTYGPVLKGKPARLYVARQWQPRNSEVEDSLLRFRSVSGLVYSSFRHDNPGPLRRNDWRA
jgi:hypothetical protein